MFGHLKAKDFLNLMEGAELPAKRRSHMDMCPQCRATFESMRTVHAEITSLATDIPEPDWALFRSSVRNELLSRSIQRQSAVRRWTGWAIRPAAAWALSVFMAIGITTVTVLWKIDNRSPSIPDSGTELTVPQDPTIELIGGAPEKSLFDDVVSLGEEDQEQFRQLLESAQKGAPHGQ
jgi:hypothetical protein